MQGRAINVVGRRIVLGGLFVSQLAAKTTLKILGNDDALGFFAAIQKA
jgi:hypothetical protein